jgi:diguanylate cyclase (GGDEF)-like protein
MRLKPQLTYPLAGLLLGTAAPVGSFLVRFLTIAQVREHPFDDLLSNAFFYFYELIATSLVFAIAGFVSGRLTDRLRRDEALYHHLAEHDALTGLHNDRAFTDRYQRALERAVTTRRPLTVVMIDLDKLKAINDEHGHAAGNEALIGVAEAVRRSKRAADVAARWGGDEFTILMEGADIPAAIRVAEGIAAHLQKTPGVTVTIGIGSAARPSLASDLFAAADRALLAGKARGRNMIEIVSI